MKKTLYLSPLEQLDEQLDEGRLVLQDELV
jgi:hypothetical protein